MGKNQCPISCRLNLLAQFPLLLETDFLNVGNNWKKIPLGQQKISQTTQVKGHDSAAERFAFQGPVRTLLCTLQGHHLSGPESLE